jgi:hypothetical protein
MRKKVFSHRRKLLDLPYIHNPNPVKLSNVTFPVYVYFMRVLVRHWPILFFRAARFNSHGMIDGFN